MEDFTGGVVESYDLKKAEDKLFGTMETAVAKRGLMSCSIKANPNEIEAIDPVTGLVKGHAYSVTGARKVCVVCGGRERESVWVGSVPAYNIQVHEMACIGTITICLM